MTARWTRKQVETVLQKSPNISKIRSKLPGISTNALTKHALRILTLKGFKVWRQNNNAVYDPKIKKFRKNSVKKGTSDVIGFRRSNGQFIACEIKTGDDTLSDEQIEFLNDVNSAGGIGIVARGIHDLEKIN